MLTIGKPKSLGEGLKRVVRYAGNGRKGKLISDTIETPMKSKSEVLFNCTNDGIITREYSNGVTIKYASKADAGKYVDNDTRDAFTMPFWLGGDLLGVFKKGKLKAALNKASGFEMTTDGEKPHLYKTRAFKTNLKEKTFLEDVKNYFKLF